MNKKFGEDNIGKILLWVGKNGVNCERWELLVLFLITFSKFL